MLALFLLPLLALSILCIVYLHLLHLAIQHVPPEAAAASHKRFRDEQVSATAQTLRRNPVNVVPFLGQRTGRRYIVVGGSGFVGGWIVLHLLARGEAAARVRILDLRAPSRSDVMNALKDGVEFIQTNITDENSVKAAFSASWPEGDEALKHGLTVFHTASLIRFIERVKFLLPPIAKVNVRGTQIVLDAARDAGATALVYTSSSSVGVRSTHWLSALWRSWPEHFVQFLDDHDTNLPQTFSECFSTYAFTKMEAETWLRTVCLRPGQGIYGSGGDAVVDAYMHRGISPTWTENIIQNCIYVENCSIGHLCAEAALLLPNTRVGGRAFYISDPNLPIAYGDIYTAVELLTSGRCKYITLHAGLVFALAHVVEAYHLTRSSILPILPQLPGDSILLQPSTFTIASTHVIINDSIARQRVEEGGLGYRAPFTSLQGIVWTALQHEDSRTSGKAAIQTGGLVSGPTNITVAPLKADSTTLLPTAAPTYGEAD
ncbi:NAD(P)-binding protein [Auriculariales sp. MPI-PUGE-AT-0066]|nr:NAD(P)-binding protein [Auriculariales sp. MPI-PUGE-AT-0066]